MKKSQIILLLALFTFANIYSQERESDFRFAFLLSPQISWLSSDNADVETNGNVWGYNFGVEMDNFFAKNYAFCTGLTINNTGGKLKYTNLGFNDQNEQITDYSTEYKLRYLEIPLSLKLQTSDFRRSSFYGQFGLFTQINIKATDGSGENINDEVRLFNAGYHFGGGLQYSLGSTTYLKVGILYNNGFLDVTKNNNKDDKANLNRLVFNFGIIF